MFPKFRKLGTKWEQQNLAFMRLSQVSHLSHGKNRWAKHENKNKSVRLPKRCSAVLRIRLFFPCFEGAAFGSWVGVGRVKSLKHPDRKPTSSHFFCARKFQQGGYRQSCLGVVGGCTKRHGCKPLGKGALAGCVHGVVNAGLCQDVPPLSKNIPPDVPPHCPG